MTLFASQSSLTLLMPRAKSSTTMYELQESLQHFLTQGSLLLLESAGSVCETPRNNEGWVISDITKVD